MNQTLQPWQDRTGTRSSAVERELTRLQNSHRLAIHMVEQRHQFYCYDHRAYEDMAAVDPHKTEESLLAGKPSLFSLSLLPAAVTGFGMPPYEAEPDHVNNYGYLLNLSQNQPHPPRVVRAATHSIISGSLSPAHKNIRLDNEDALSDYYQRFQPSKEAIEALPKWERQPFITEQTTQAIYHAAADKNTGAKFADAQLDALGDYYRCKADTLADRENDRLFELSEVLATANHTNIAAITVPSYRTSAIDAKQYDARLHLQAALIGLQHLDQNIHLPVVIYHVTPPQQGQCSYVGETREELVRVGLNALATLGAQGMAALKDHLDHTHMRYTSLVAAVQNNLQIDLNHSAEGPDGWLKAVAEKQAALPKAAPSR